ncbi:MAG: hypothetical protein IKU43_09945 [Clostridia bacterium]|nr:hypothetical protein [Clostridia bacterium]
MDKLDLEEKILGGIFGVVSIVAAIFEVCTGEHSVSAVFGTVKDIFATLIVVILFIAVMRALKPKKAKNFRELLDNAMSEVEETYSPLVRKAVEKETDSEAKTKKLQAVIRYEIASDINVLFSKGNSSYIRFFDIDAEKPDAIVFPVRETFFGNSDNAPFNAEKIILKISNSIQRKFPEYTVNGDFKKNEISVEFGKTLSGADDAKELSRLIDNVVLLFVAENKKI